MPKGWSCSRCDAISLLILQGKRIKLSANRKSTPQGLKPNVFSTRYGTAEAAPFQIAEFFRMLFVLLHIFKHTEVVVFSHRHWWI
jgi:hypothetical protein